MDDWEAEDFQPTPAKVELKRNWDDEDVDENDIKNSWDDDESNPATEKAPKKAVVEKNGKTADYQATAQLFGAKTEETCFDIFIPKSESDFLEYADMISRKLVPYEKSFHYIGLLKAVMRLSVAKMKAADVREIYFSYILH